MAGALKRRPPGAGAGPHRFEMTPDFVSRLENPERIAGMPSGEIVSRMSIRKADVIADLGAGIGYFTFPLAAKAKSVIAIDLEPSMIQELSDRIAERKA